jgi:hypothetical protein
VGVLFFVCHVPLVEVEVEGVVEVVVVVEVPYFSFPGTLVYLPTCLPAYARYAYLPAQRGVVWIPGLRI